MLIQVRKIIKEQIDNWNLIVRMDQFETKGMYQIHYLGTFWQFLNPALQVAIYYTVFGIGLRGGSDIDGVPFIAWLVLGLIPWFFIAPTMIQGSNSVHQKVNLVTKMNFPVSLLPTIRIVGNSYQIIVLLFILFLVILLNGIFPTIYLLQLPYYLFCLYAFLFSFTILISTIATLIRDYQVLLQSMMRMLFYLSPILWNPEGERVPDWLSSILKLNPFYYIIQGVRRSFLGGSWFFEDIIYALYFWVLTLILLYFVLVLHYKFKKDFVDYL